MRRADRSFRVLVVSPSFKDRSLMREGYRETMELFNGLRIVGQEQAFFQRYDPEAGWKTIHAKGNSKVA